MTAGAAAARRGAVAILREGRFHQPNVPRPLHSLLHAIGTALQAPGHAIGQLAAWLGGVLGGGAVTGWALLLLLLGAVSALIARRYSRAALARAPRTAGGHSGGPRAADLQSAAEQAEREGRYGEAVRLRFQAGVARLADRQLLPAGEALLTRQISQRLNSAEFDALARQFDAIAYGDAPAARADAERARRGWQALQTPAGR